ncbi:crotonase/enoyl-CoA hydratase family protein [Limibaculum sp. FT325]|uniref:crotonase/enoyl-CoA hydratase family protein n=1 Tax=Thermohalobaculum sediminis TaxID=2939436 RepID=UPI0020BE7AD2|nr:crotonase/enoyl-CoA hydratase family protein [Limibaculum sediminis]MCL5775415.1 crotonase/enoyl-CoA hydratase family protein [Limibaculum sediminis]
MPFQTIRLERDARGVAALTLARPDKHNSLNATMIADLAVAARQIADDPAIRAVVLTGEGESFCAGGDLGWMRQQMEADRATRISEALSLARMLKALNDLPKPLIARVNGQAYGGGIGMISVCDAAVAATTAKFGLTEVRLGLIPATISPYVVARLTPPRAREVFFSGRIFDAEEAARLGLITRAVAPADIDAAVEAEVAPYLAAAPGAVAAAKRLVARFSPPIGEAELQATATALADQWETPEAAEGIAAFFARRSPPWRAG